METYFILGILNPASLFFPEYCGPTPECDGDGPVNVDVTLAVGTEIFNIASLVANSRLFSDLSYAISSSSSDLFAVDRTTGLCLLKILSSDISVLNIAE